MNIENITVQKYPISQLLDPESKARYHIPKYQREYTWGTREWEALFDDLLDNEEGYFLGTIICINITEDSINSLEYEVVDGQQRLTTLSLFLAALYDSLQEHNDELDEDQLSDMLQLKRKLVLKKTQSDIRIVPQIQNNNLEDYLALLGAHNIIPTYEKPRNAGNRRIYKSFAYFKKRIADKISDSENPVEVLFDLLTKINSAILVMIGVTNHADAYMLFESFNNRGTPLTSVDLIKNSLLSKLDIQDGKNLDYYFTRWTNILADLGDEYSVQERFLRQNYNAFRKSINAPFVINPERPYPLGTIATRSNLLDIYEKLITEDPVDFLNELSKNATLYGQITLNKTQDISDELKDSYLNLQRIQGVPSYVLLLYLLRNMSELELKEVDIIRINQLLVNFFVRRNLTDIPATRDLTRMFMEFIEEIEKNSYIGNDVYLALQKKLVSCSASDPVFEEKLRGSVYDDNISVTRFILNALAEKGMTKETEHDLWKRTGNNQFVWTIEHIFPQGSNIPESWVNMIADGDVEKAKEYQTLYVHTFGNLTISGYNSNLGNKSFEEKKERKNSDGAYIGYRNGLSLNEDVCDKDKWTVDVIKERTDRMVKQILEMFKLQ